MYAHHGGLLCFWRRLRYGQAMTRRFSKPAKSIADQIALLQSRGMAVGDLAAATRALQNISYYRLRAYWLYFEIDPSGEDHQLRPGTSFEQVLALYEFDRRLRLLIMDGIERIEVAARGAWAHHLAMTYGPHGYLNAAHYPNVGKFQRNLKQLQDEVDRSHDTFIQHYKRTYNSPKLPPIWMASELVSFGLLSKFLSSLGKRADKKQIARAFGLDDRVFIGFLHHLATVRNICAHHGRLWNKAFTVTAILPTAPHDLAISVNHAAPRQLYNTLTIMLHILHRIDPASDWKDRLFELLGENPVGDSAAMGFPGNAVGVPMWRR
jgi:abortive infection bacteriophage resistance protein